MENNINNLKLNIIERSTNNKYEIMCNLNENVYDLKQKIEIISGISYKFQVLNYSGLILHRSEEKLAEREIKNDDEIILTIYNSFILYLVKIKKKLGRETADIVEFDHKPTYEEVIKAIQNITGCDAEMISTCYKKYETVDNENITKDEYTTQDIIYYKLSRLFIKTKNNMFTLIYNGNNTILEVKQMIENKTGIEITSQSLIFAGKLLDNDNQTLNEYNTENNVTLFLVVK